MSKGASKLTPGKRIRLTSDNNDYDLHVVAEGLEEQDEKVIVFFGKHSTWQGLVKIRTRVIVCSSMSHCMYMFLDFCVV